MGGHVGDVLDVWPNEVVQRVQVGGGGGTVREGYKDVALLLKPILGLFGLVDRRRVPLPHPGSATGHLITPEDHHTLQHIQVHFGVGFQADFGDVRWHEVALTWNHTKDYNCSRKLCFHHPWHVPVIRGNPDLHFEGAGNGSVVITWIGREHELYSGAFPISLVEHCVTFRHDRRLLSLWGFLHNWPTRRWSATKKENRFSLNGNGIMSSFLGRQFYRSTLYFLSLRAGPGPVGVFKGEDNMVGGETLSVMVLSLDESSMMMIDVADTKEFFFQVIIQSFLWSLCHVD